jgi:hypothetical protein
MGASLTPYNMGCRAQISGKLKGEVLMDALAETLDTKLRTWKPETAAQVRERIAEVIELADDDVLDLMRSRACEQEVLDILDEPSIR